MLFWNEVKKLWRQRAAKVFLALVAALLLFLCIMNITLGSSAFFYSGPENTALQKQYAQRWKGSLTGEKLAEALAFYQQGYADESKLVYDEQWGVWGPSNEQYAAYLIPTMDVLAPLESVLQRGTYERGTLRDARSEDALAFYDLRAQWLEEFLDGQFPQDMPGAAQDKAFFEAQEARVEKPFYYDYFGAGSVSGGLRTWAEMLSSNIPYLQFFLVLGLGQIFAAEWRRKAAPVLLCTKHGRGALARAKLLAGLFWILAASVCMLAVYLAFQFSVLGTSGLACPVQLIKPLATAPLTIWQTELICITFSACAYGRLGGSCFHRRCWQPCVPYCACAHGSTADKARARAERGRYSFSAAGRAVQGVYPGTVRLTFFLRKNTKYSKMNLYIREVGPFCRKKEQEVPHAEGAV